jgi:hypothetical protein
MNKEYSFAVAGHFDRDIYTSSQTRERALNAAIVQANISESFEVYLEIFDAFYADNVEVSIENQEQPISGKAIARSLLAGFLVPLHMMAEIGGLLVSVRQSSFPSDRANETNSAWTVELVGVSGNTCTIGWRALRKWNRSQVVFEHHYDLQQTGGPLTLADLSLDPRSSIFRKAS